MRPDGHDHGYPPIGAYGLVGDCRSAALISREGSLDWLCLPRFDSPSIFGALLDRERGGRFVVRAAGFRETRRRYLDGTPVLETTFVTPTGRLRLLDLMPAAAEADKRTELAGDHEVLRVAEALDGEVDVEVLYDPRPAYGRMVPTLLDRGALGVSCDSGRELLVLRSEIPLAPSSEGPGLVGRATLRRGERRRLALGFTSTQPAVLPVLGEAADRRLERTVRWWQDWIACARYHGPYRELVARSALTLKLMAYAPSGGIVAAPTTSLPEQIGGPRNWDYRFCWLRDASLTLRALLDLGFTAEGHAFIAWLLHATRLTWPELQNLYDVFGESRLPERELAHLEGYAGSRPVRTGNGAIGQLQLDIYGEVIDAAYRFVVRGGRLARRTTRVLVGLGRTVCRLWPEPDEGLWEIRSGRRQHTYSKAMCWVALDRLLRLDAQGHLRAPRPEFEAAQAAIRREIETRGYDARLDSYVSVLDGDDVDASLFLLGINGYADPASPRMRGTCARIHARLGKNGLIYRYRGMDDGLPGGEGAFGIASFWAVECRARQGDLDGAADAFERVAGYANDLGLFAEEIDADSGAALGNFPQAFTHVGLINAALTLSERAGLEPPPEAAATCRERQV